MTADQEVQPAPCQATGDNQLQDAKVASQPGIARFFPPRKGRNFYE